MFVMVTGGSGSGKSAYAEKLIQDFGERKRYYIATMQCEDEETKERIRRHRRMRAGKQFETLECPVGLETVRVQQDSAVLLECMSNLAANEYFNGARHAPQEVADRILDGLWRLREQCALLVVVTNELFSDGVEYDAETKNYLDCLGRINRGMAGAADRVTEVVFGIPVDHPRKHGE